MAASLMEKPQSSLYFRLAVTECSFQTLSDRWRLPAMFLAA